MKRVLIILSCICLIVCLAVPGFAVSSFIDPIDYIVTESVNGDNNWINVSIPASAVIIKWDKTKNGSWTNAQTGSSATFPADLQSHDIYSSVTTPIDITSIIDGTTITMQYSCTVNSGIQPQASHGRWFFRYLDINGAVIGDQITSINISADFDTSYISVIMDKPDNAVAMNVYYQWLDTTAQNSFTININSINFSCLVSALQRVQQETGKTNELLEHVINGQVNPTPPEFDDSMNQAINKEDSLVNMFPDGTLENFGGNVVGLMDSLLLYAGAFGLVKAFWEPFIELEWFNIILTASLALGLLGAVLGTFLTTSKASNHDGKGKD